MNIIDLAYMLSIGPHYLWHRYKTQKYGPDTQEKTGVSLDRLSIGGPTVWVHAVSVGEAVAARDIIRLFKTENPSWTVRVSTTTATGRGVAQNDWGAQNVFYYPLDFSWMVRRAFDAVAPDMIVLMELEIWPNFLAEAARRQIPVVVANARITDRTLRRLRYIPSVTKKMILPVVSWLAQSEEYADRVLKLGVDPARIEVTGSVKYDAVPEVLDQSITESYRSLFSCTRQNWYEGGTMLIVAGSTHPGEERTLLAAVFDALPKGQIPPKIVLAPRHPERLDEVEKEASAFGSVVRRSALPASQGDIILVDTMGELAKLYSAADVVFVGGTLVPHGGQNFIEPCGLAKPTIVGPNLWNFAEPAELLQKRDCLTVIHQPIELKQVFEKIFAEPEKAKEQGIRARSLLLEKRGAARRIAGRLTEIAKKLS